MKDKEIKHLLTLRMRFKAIRSAQQKLAEEQKQFSGLQQLPRQDYETVYNIVNTTLQSLETQIDEQIKGKTKKNFTRKDNNTLLSTEQQIKGSNSQIQEPFFNQNLTNAYQQQQQQTLSCTTSPCFSFNNNSSYQSDTYHQSNNSAAEGFTINQKLHPLPDQTLNNNQVNLMQIEKDWQKDYLDSCERETFEDEDEDINEFNDFHSKREESSNIFNCPDKQSLDFHPQNLRSIFEIKQLFTENNKESLVVDIQHNQDSSIFMIEHYQRQVKSAKKIKEEYLELQSNNNIKELDSIDEYFNFVTPEKLNYLEINEENHVLETKSCEILHSKQLFNKLKGEEEIIGENNIHVDDVCELMEIDRMNNIQQMINRDNIEDNNTVKRVLRNIKNCQINSDKNMKSCKNINMDQNTDCSKKGFESFDKLVELTEANERERNNLDTSQKDVFMRSNSSLEQEEPRVQVEKVEGYLERQVDCILKSEDCLDKTLIQEGAKEEISSQDLVAEKEIEEKEVIIDISENVREINEQVQVEQDIEEENSNEKQDKKKRKKRKKRKKLALDVKISKEVNNEQEIEEEAVFEDNQEQIEEEMVENDNQKEEPQLRPYTRGPYNFYSEELKKKAIKDYLQLKDIKRAAEINDVKVKNLKRWIYVGHKRKEGGGRKKEDPIMEDQVFAWLENQYEKDNIGVTRNEIRVKALQLSNKQGKFKASKGWLEKFFSRYNCKHMSRKDQIYPGQTDHHEEGEFKKQVEEEKQI